MTPRKRRSPAKDIKPVNKGLLLGYARVSKGDDQTNTMQAKALRAAGCRRLFEEAASGGRWDRPELHRMLDYLRELDTVVVWKLDRLSRSLKDVLHIMERIAKAGAGFRSITENIDTTTPAGRMMMQMVASFAEFERAMIRERESAGLAAARAEGRVGGRRKKLDTAKRREIAESVHLGPQIRCPRWPVSTASANRPSHVSSPSTAPAWLSVQFCTNRPVTPKATGTVISAYFAAIILAYMCIDHIDLPALLLIGSSPDARSAD
jgi:hypothetical protein